MKQWRKVFRPIALVVILALIFPFAVLADTQGVDNDLAMSGNQNIVNLTAAPGATVNTSGQVVIEYSGQNHLVAGNVITFVADSAATTIPAGYTVSSLPLTVPNPWTGGSVSGWSNVSFTAPITPGSYSYTVKWNATNVICQKGNCLTGAPALVINLTVTPPSDTTAPVITPDISGTLGNNGWYVSDVTVSWSVGDAESGIASSSGCSSTLLTTDTAGTTLTCSATNGASLSSSSSVTIKIDKTSPTVSITGPSVVLQGSSASATVGASDALSGLAVDPSGTPSLNTSSVGTQTVVVTATDRASNSASASLTYTVWGINGPFAPLVKNGNGAGQFKAGSTIPVKFQITDGSSLITTASGSVSIGSASAAFRWDATAQQYVANVKTAAATGTFSVNLDVAGVSSATIATVNLR